ncbi:hypothetical protein F4554_001065 [Actinopolymorpha rutila]|uniref:Uncharacterized protein n=1 Tax=Actinopolymorpha rutila TaxID=446787 RepID=A0A852Z4Z0_9ACTN|nr:hypothetical protein [Actinopolymorpha rutila]NYH88427.1 hypothetical protein [Actinopolymorpha rutila]
MSVLVSRRVGVSLAKDVRTGRAGGTTGVRHRIRVGDVATSPGLALCVVRVRAAGGLLGLGVPGAIAAGGLRGLGVLSLGARGAAGVAGARVLLSGLALGLAFGVGGLAGAGHGADGVEVVDGAEPEAVHQLLQSDEHGDAVSAASAVGGGFPLGHPGDQFGERVPTLLVQRPFVGVGAGVGGDESFDDLAELFHLQHRQLDHHGLGAGNAVGQVLQGPFAFGGAFVLGQLLSQSAFPLLRREHLQQVPSQHPHVVGVPPLRLFDQVILRLVELAGADVGGQVLDRERDHLRMPKRQLPTGKSPRGQGHRAVQIPGQHHRRTGVPARHPLGVA